MKRKSQIIKQVSGNFHIQKSLKAWKKRDALTLFFSILLYYIPFGRPKDGERN
jgi:hypothetical protein